MREMGPCRQQQTSSKTAMTTRHAISQTFGSVVVVVGSLGGEWGVEMVVGRGTIHGATNLTGAPVVVVVDIVGW